MHFCILVSSSFLQKSTNVVVLCIFLLFFVLCLWSYLACVFTRTLSTVWILILDPGPITHQLIEEYIEMYGDFQMRYCNSCGQLKPPRFHHCKICRVWIWSILRHRCVLLIWIITVLGLATVLDIRIRNFSFCFYYMPGSNARF